MDWWIEAAAKGSNQATHPWREAPRPQKPGVERGTNSNKSTQIGLESLGSQLVWLGIWPNGSFRFRFCWVLSVWDSGFWMISMIYNKKSPPNPFLGTVDWRLNTFVGVSRRHTTNVDHLQIFQVSRGRPQLLLQLFDGHQRIQFLGSPEHIARQRSDDHGGLESRSHGSRFDSATFAAKCRVFHRCWRFLFRKAVTMLRVTTAIILRKILPENTMTALGSAKSNTQVCLTQRIWGKGLLGPRDAKKTACYQM